MKRNVAQLYRSTLKRVLGVSDLFAIGFGDLGSSIYYALGITALYALGATPIALSLAGLVFICTALTYAELSSTYHESGGTASFARHAFNDLISFIAGWGLLFDYIITIAISAFAVAPYLAVFYAPLKQTELYHTGFTVLLILALLILNIIGIRQSTRVNFVLVTVTIFTQVVIVAIAFTFLFKQGTILQNLRINVPGALWSPTWPEFWKGTAMAMVAYTGIESIAQLGAEARQPSRTVPRSIMITMVVLILMYLGISISALLAVSPTELGTTYVSDPIAGIATHLPFGGELLGAWVGIFAAMLLISASNSGLVGASRLSFNMGEFYQLPRFFYRLHKKFNTPHAALIFFAVVSALLVAASRGELSFLADLYNFGAMLAFFFAHLSLIVLRIKKPDLKRPFRIGLNIPIRGYSIPITAVIGCLATASVWFLVVITKPEGRYFGCAWMILGIGTFLYYRRRAKLAAVGLEIERIHVPHYEPLEIKNILLPIVDKTQTETVQMACELARLHGAKITALHLMTVSYPISLDANLPKHKRLAEAALKRVDAVAREFGLTVELNMHRTRSVTNAILEVLKKNKHDLVILGTSRERGGRGFGLITETILRKAPCRVWVCTAQKRDGLLREGRLIVTS